MHRERRRDYFYNNTSTYARTKKLTVTVRDREEAAKGAEFPLRF
ncbi:MAG: hypothetical protein ACLVLH_08590 [Eisenbergiella massiliensis]